MYNTLYDRQKNNVCDALTWNGEPRRTPKKLSVPCSGSDGNWRQKHGESRHCQKEYLVLCDGSDLTGTGGSTSFRGKKKALTRL
ncbi:MAG: hypothetical protein GXY31_03840 [Bacteroidales bacterium]|nr:hypothetical protein [Bacteroidales bacterium]